MAGLVRKLAKNAPFLRPAASLKTHLFPKFTPSLSHPGPPKPESTENPFSHSGPANLHNAQSSNLLRIFPNFPLGYCLNPISQTGFEKAGAFDIVEDGRDNARTIWADSVKKKRKKKMNKHKYKKLRKRLRRKSRT